MTGDLYYFYESDLDRTNIKEFYDALPSRLKAKFKASLHGIQIGEGNVLQGYRGPSNMCNGGSGDSRQLKPSHGLQEIKYWWGARKDFNFIPGVGTIIYTGCRTSQYFSGKLEWSSLYFDSQTGECLSHDKREAAAILKNRSRKVRTVESKPEAMSCNYDSDDDEEALEERMAARDEARAEKLNFQGDQLFDQGEYTHARKKYEEALNASKESDSRHKYKRNLYKAQTEINANKRFHQGNRLFMMGRFRDALDEYHAAYIMSDTFYARQIYRDSEEKARIEGIAARLCYEGDELSNQGRFEEAISRYERAIEISRIDNIRETCRANIANAGYEITAIGLNSAGDNLFNQGSFWSAQDKYNRAANISKVRIGMYRAKAKRAQDEIDALTLNSDGDDFYNHGNYNEARRMYLEANAKSKVDTQRKKYLANANRAATEVDAANSNSQGNNFYNKGKFNDALRYYQLACNTSKVAAQITKYKTNIDKAQVEIDALNLNAQGNNFFNVGRYNDAVSSYIAASNKSQITTQKNVYLSNKNKTQDVINKVNMLDKLWKQAWDVENDTKNDRSEEAKNLFQKVLSESKENLKTFPENTKFKQFNALAILKIEGNKLFNEGVQSQETGTTLFQKAQELNQQEQYELANEKFKEAKKYFQEALAKFQIGSRSDQRFAPCVEFVQDLMDVVIDSIKITEQCILSKRLNKLEITSESKSGVHTCETNVSGKQNNYSQHI